MLVKKMIYFMNLFINNLLSFFGMLPLAGSIEGKIRSNHPSHCFYYIKQNIVAETKSAILLSHKTPYDFFAIFL